MEQRDAARITAGHHVPNKSTLVSAHRPVDRDPAAESSHPGVLVVDDDRGTRETFHLALRCQGFRVGLAGSGAEGMTMARSGRFDALLIDYWLPDVPGLQVVRALRRDRQLAPFVLMSACLTTDVTVEAMRLGACDVIDKPVWVETLVDVVGSMVAQWRGRRVRRSVEGLAVPDVNAIRLRPRSAAERWALHVLKGCGADRDLRTLDDWAACAGVSVRMLREACRLVRLKCRDTRDFMRLLRAVIRSCADGSDLLALLDVSDLRTLTVLLERGGIPSRAGPVHLTVDEFVSRQRYIRPDHSALTALRDLLDACQSRSLKGSDHADI